MKKIIWTKNLFEQKIKKNLYIWLFGENSINLVSLQELNWHTELRNSAKWLQQNPYKMG